MSNYAWEPWNGKMLIMSYFTGNACNKNKYAATFAGGEKEGEKKWGRKQLVSNVRWWAKAQEINKTTSTNIILCILETLRDLTVQSGDRHHKMGEGSQQLSVKGTKLEH